MWNLVELYVTDAYSAVGPLHRVNVDSVADVSDVIAASIFRAEE
jgi:hypothetical protein